MCHHSSCLEMTKKKNSKDIMVIKRAQRHPDGHIQGSSPAPVTRSSPTAAFPWENSRIQALNKGSDVAHVVNSPSFPNLH